MSITRAEHVALSSTALAFALTAILAGTGYAVESNGFAAASIEALGWVGAGIVALVGEVCIIEGYRRVVAPRYPRVAVVGAWSVASLGIGDVLYNVWILNAVGLPETVSMRLLGAAGIVSVVAVVLAARSELKTGVERAPKIPREVPVTILVILVALSGTFTGEVTPVETGSANTTEKIIRRELVGDYRLRGE